MLPASQAFTGCDTTSKIGTKHKALDIFDIDDNQNALVPLGNGLQLTTEQLNALEEVYLKILDKIGKTADEARLIIFSHSCRTGVNLGNIPCTSDAFK